MIFVTLGTHHDPFPRLIEGLAALRGEALVVQYGHNPAPANAAAAVDFMSFAEMEKHIRQARAVVTHAGVGSILTCIRNGRTPLVVPRQRSLGEHVDDHQVELTRGLEEQGKVIPVWDVGQLAQLVASAPAPAAAPMTATGQLHEAVRDALVVEPRPRRWRLRRRGAAVGTA